MNNKVHSFYALCFADDRGINIEIQGVNLGKGNGTIYLTGHVGELAKDAMQVNKTILAIRKPQFLLYDYHIHFEYLRLKKDGPSWGLACFVLLCMIADIPLIKYKQEIVAATGEIDLYGNVRPVRYLEEKIDSILNHDSSKIILIPKIQNFNSSNNNIVQITNVDDLLI